MKKIFFLTILFLFAMQGNTYAKQFTDTKIEYALSNYVTVFSQNIKQAVQYAESHGITRIGDLILVELALDEGKHTSDLNREIFRKFEVKVDSESDNFIILWISTEKLKAFSEEITNVLLLHRPIKFMPVVISEGVEAIEAGVFHEEGFSGADVKIGVFDLGFNLADDARDEGELPRFTARNFTNEDFFGGNIHGTACSEIIYDLAPEAELYLIKIWNSADFENALEYAHDEGINITSMSLSWHIPNGDYFNGEDRLSELVNDAFEDSLFFIQSAGNSAHATYREDFNDGGGENQYHRFDENVIVNPFGQNADRVYVFEQGTNLSISLIWDDFPTTDQDFDLELLHKVEDEWQIVDRANDVQNGNDPPYERIDYVVQEQGEYGIRVLRSDADEGMDFTLKTYPYDIAYNTPAGSISVPAIAEGCYAVGAVNFNEWADDDDVNAEGFSSRGPTYDGRIKPDIAAPDGVSTYAYGLDDRAFFGTSASCPHAAGAAALVLSSNLDFTNEDLRDYLNRHAIDVGQEGADNTFGAGLLRLEIEYEDIEGIFINEFQADNESTILDPMDEFEDWIELYNQNDEDFDLSGLYLSNDSEDPDKWQIPEMTIIEPGRHLLIWADQDLEDEGIHANYQLSRMGGEIGLYQRRGMDFVEIDFIRYNRQQTDWSYGRESDGAEDWIEFEIPTPGALNEIIDPGPELQHFTDFLRTEPNHSILVLEFQNAGEGVPSGWEIGVFTPDGMLTGAGIWTDGENVGFPVWGDDAETEEIDGFRDGEEMSFMGWDDEADEEWRLEVEIVEGRIEWSDRGFTVLNLNVLDEEEGRIEIDLREGWNMISINVSPGEEYYNFDRDERGPNVVLMMRQFTEEDILILMKNEIGEFYIPAWDYYNIDYWNLVEGYQVKMEEEAVFEMPGDQIDPQADVPIEEGWNIIAYIPNYDLDVSAPEFYGVSPIIDHIIIFKDYLGRFINPEWEYGNLDYLTAGQGYQVKVDADVVLNYPEPPEEVQFSGGGSYQTNLPGRKPTGSNMSLLILSDDAILSADAEIMARNSSGLNIGRGKFNELGQCGIAIWGDDPTTFAKEGLAENEAFQILMVDTSSIESQLKIKSLLRGDGLTFEKDGLIVLNGSFVVEIPNSSYLSNAYPNPFNSSARITFGLKESERISLEIYNQQGRRVAQLYNGIQSAGYHSLTWDASSMPSGIYFARMQSGSKYFQEKLLLVK